LIASTHLAVGALIGTLAYRFLFRLHWLLVLTVAFAFGLASHFLLDMIPHGEGIYSDKSNFNFWIILSVELLVVFILVYFLGFYKPLGSLSNISIFAALVGSAFPDLPAIFIGVFKVNWNWLNNLDKINSIFHSHPPDNFLIGFLPQILVSVFALLIMYFVKKPA